MMEGSAPIDASAERAVTDEPVMTEAAADEFWDTVDGGYLNFTSVIEARAEEIMCVLSQRTHSSQHTEAK